MQINTNTTEGKAELIAYAALDLQRDYVETAPEHALLGELAALAPLSRALFFDAVEHALSIVQDLAHK